MLALEVEYLLGRAAATERHDRERAEWPPHPGRLFSALVDAAFQALTRDDLDAAREALRWLEKLPPPTIAAPDAERREVIKVFVPVNDTELPDIDALLDPPAPTPPKRSGKKPAPDPEAAARQAAEKLTKEAKRLDNAAEKAVELLPERRPRQERFFPVVIPDSPVVHFIWRDAPTDGVAAHGPVLGRIAAAVTYLGQSSSLVRVAVVEAAPEATFVPDPAGRHTFRVPAAGRLKDLERTHARGARPSPGLYAAYRHVRETARVPAAEAEPALGDVVVCQVRGPALPLGGATRLTLAVRDALIAATDRDPDTVKTLVSGHAPDGARTGAEHVAYVPLANVGHRHADGRVMGFAVVLPRGLDRFGDDRRGILQAVAGLAKVWCGGDGFAAGPDAPPGVRYEWDVTMPFEDLPKSLDARPYTRPAQVWATVTPVLLDRHGEPAEETVAAAVRRAFTDPPEIVQVVTSPVSWHRGAPPSHAFASRRRAGYQARHRVHARVEFRHPVRGPLVAGAGRYFGLGLFRALDSEGRG